MEQIILRITMVFIGYMWYIMMVGAADLERKEQITTIGLLLIISIIVIRRVNL